MQENQKRKVPHYDYMVVHQGGYANASGDGAAVAGVIGSLLGTVGVVLLQNAQRNKELKTQKELAQQQIDAQKQVELEKAKQPVIVNTPATSHAGLYVGLGLGALILTAGIVYMIKRKAA